MPWNYSKFSLTDVAGACYTVGMPYIRMVNYRNTHIAGLELLHGRLTIDIFGGEGGRLNDLGLHDPVSTPCDTFCMDYDDENEANADFALLQEWMDCDLPVTVEIFAPL